MNKRCLTPICIGRHDEKNKSGRRNEKNKSGRRDRKEEMKEMPNEKAEFSVMTIKREGKINLISLRLRRVEKEAGVFLTI